MAGLKKSEINIKFIVKFLLNKKENIKSEIF